MSQPDITIEFFGVPRARAGVKQLFVSAATVSEAFAAVIQKCPKLADLLQGDGSLSPQYLVSLDGQYFVSDISHPLLPGDRLLLLSADAGG